jgi:putative phosphoribosyl transferase
MIDNWKLTVHSVFALEKYRNKDVLVVNTSCTGQYPENKVAHYLNAESSMMFSRRLVYPFNPKASFGAVAEEGTLFISEMGRQYQSCDEMRQIIRRKKQQIQEDVENLRLGEPLPAMKGRTVIISSKNPDCWPGIIATSLLCKKKGASKIVVVLEKHDKKAVAKLESKVNEVLVIELPPLLSPFQDLPGISSDN